MRFLAYLSGIFAFLLFVLSIESIISEGRLWVEGLHAATYALLVAAVLFWMAQLTKILKDIRSALADNEKAEVQDS